MNIMKFSLIIVGFLFCSLGCFEEPGKTIGDVILTDNQQSTQEPPLIDNTIMMNTEKSFNSDLAPILNMKCATDNCHIAGGPQGLDFSTYQAFISGGVKGPVFTPGDADRSSIIAEIISGRMPLGAPKLSEVEIQVFADWINNQTATVDVPVDDSPQPQIPQPGQPISFEQHLLPILTARCAYSGCHDANGPDHLDFRTYQTFIRSAEEEDVFVPGNARSSDIIEEIVSGRMPPDSPPLTNAQIQLFKDWINQQDPADFPNLRYDDDDDDDDDHDHDDYDDDDHDHDDEDNYDDDDDDEDDDDDDDDD